MQKLLICATKELATKLEEKLRHHYDVQSDILEVMMIIIRVMPLSAK